MKKQASLPDTPGLHWQNASRLVNRYVGTMNIISTTAYARISSQLSHRQ